MKNLTYNAKKSDIYMLKLYIEWRNFFQQEIGYITSFVQRIQNILILFASVFLCFCTPSTTKKKIVATKKSTTFSKLTGCLSVHVSTCVCS